MSQLNDKAKRLRFQEIVDSIPDEVAAFFQKFESSRSRLALTQEIDVLNAVAHEEYLACAGTGGKTGRRPTALMRWYEVAFRRWRSQKEPQRIHHVRPHVRAARFPAGFLVRGGAQCAIVGHSRLRTRAAAGV